MVWDHRVRTARGRMGLRRAISSDDFTFGIASSKYGSECCPIMRMPSLVALALLPALTVIPAGESQVPCIEDDPCPVSVYTSGCIATIANPTCTFTCQWSASHQITVFGEASGSLVCNGTETAGCSAEGSLQCRDDGGHGVGGGSYTATCEVEGRGIAICTSG